MMLSLSLGAAAAAARRKVMPLLSRRRTAFERAKLGQVGPVGPAGRPAEAVPSVLACVRKLEKIPLMRNG